MNGNHLSTAALELAWALYATRILTGGPFEDEKKRRARNHLRTAEEALRAWMRENEVAEWVLAHDGVHHIHVMTDGALSRKIVRISTPTAHIERALEMLPGDWCASGVRYHWERKSDHANTLRAELRAAREGL